MRHEFEDLQKASSGCDGSADILISVQLSNDREAYSEAIAEPAGEEPGALDVLTQRVAETANVGELKKGDTVAVVEAGKLEQAKVMELPPSSEGEYTLSIWKRHSREHHPYEEGYDTSKPWLKRCRRIDIYKHRKDRQTLSPISMRSAEKHVDAARQLRREPSLLGLSVDGSLSVPTASEEFLLLLYADAERLLPRLTLELEQVESSVRAAGYRTALKMAPLKESGRAVVKAMEKYQGSYDCLTDLARCTFECPTLAAATAVLDALAGSQVMDVLLIKNRLMLAYDASPSGGYRDLLINVRLKDPNLPHIAEIQITLTPLLQLKTGGGHTAYALGRLLNLFDPETWRYDGLLSQRVVASIHSGVVRDLSCAGEVPEHLGALGRSFSSPSCTLTKIRIVQCAWPPEVLVCDVLSALAQLGTRLTFVSISKVQGAAEYELPRVFFERCTRLTDLGLYESNLSGAIPEAIGRCSNLLGLVLFGNKLSGPLPEGLFAGCGRLQKVILHRNRLTGPLPGSLGRSTALHTLHLGDNELEGALPADVGRCAALQSLELYGNRLSGELPEELGRCALLHNLQLSGNDGLSGSVPASALAGLAHLTDLRLDGCSGLRISAEGKKSMEDAIAAHGEQSICKLPDVE